GANDVELVHALRVADEVWMRPRRAQPLVVARGDDVSGRKQVRTPFEKERLQRALEERGRAVRRDADRSVPVGHDASTPCRRRTVGNDDEPADGRRLPVVPGGDVEDAVRRGTGAKAGQDLAADERSRRAGWEW